MLKNFAMNHVGHVVEFCLGVFYLTAMAGAAMAVRQEHALAWLANVGLGCALLLAVRRSRSSMLTWMILASALLNVAYLVNRDWWVREGWIAAATPFYQLLSKLHASVSLVSTESADGAMLALVPLQITAVRVRRALGRAMWPWAASAAATVGLLLAGASKGTLLLLLPAIVAGSIRPLRPIDVRGKWVAVVFAALVFAAAAALASGAITRIVSIERPWLAVSFDTARDFWLTGVGAGNFSRTFSLYRAVLPTTYLSHAQNMYLDIWLTQGIVGLTAFLGLCLAALFTALRALHVEHGVDAMWRTASFASLVILMLHGTYDDPYFDGGRLFPVLGLVIGAALRRSAVLQEWQGVSRSEWRKRQIVRMSRTMRRALLVLAPLSLGVLPSVQAAAFADFGALVQAHIEIRALQDAPANDVARRAALTNAGVAERAYRRALSLDPDNGTALLRLGQIALLRREFPVARNLLEAALRTNPSGRAERLLLGEAYWRQGDVDAAYRLWDGVHDWELSIEARRSQE